MVSKSVESPDQGSFFVETDQTSGVTDPALQTRGKSFEVAPDGAYAEPTTASAEPLQPENPELLARVRQQVTIHEHQVAQSGRHSPLQRDGNYLNIRLGDVLPNGMIVKRSNFRQAQQVAAELEAERVRNR